MQGDDLREALKASVEESPVAEVVRRLREMAAECYETADKLANGKSELWAHTRIKETAKGNAFMRAAAVVEMGLGGGVKG